MIAGRGLALAVRGGIAETPDDLLGLAVDDVDFSEVARVDGVLIRLGVIAHRIPVRPVRPREIAHAQGQMPVDVDLIRPRADVVPHMPFPRDFALGGDFEDGVGPDALQGLVVRALSGRAHPVAAEGGVVGVAALGQRLVIGLVFPDQDGRVAVGQAVESVVGYLAGIGDLVFPYHPAVPGVFAQQAVPAAEIDRAARDFFGAQQVAVREEFGVEGGRIVLPRVNDVAFHINKIGHLAAGVFRRVHNPRTDLVCGVKRV